MDTKKVLILSLFTSVAVIAYLFESFLPRFLPFIRIGLANIIVTVFIYNRQFKAALIILTGKILVGGFLSGVILSPVVALTVSGNTLAFLMMSTAIIMGINFSMIGLSVIGAVGHNLGQLFAVRMFLIKDDALFTVIPLLLLVALLSGLLTGFAASILDSKLSRKYLKIF